MGLDGHLKALGLRPEATGWWSVAHRCRERCHEAKLQEVPAGGWCLPWWVGHGWVSGGWFMVLYEVYGWFFWSRLMVQRCLLIVIGE